jgi:hypothetical protein
MQLLLRPANVSREGGHWQDEDYDVFDGDRDVGRIFQQADGQCFWGVAFHLTRRKSYGHAPSLDDAKAAFKADQSRRLAGAPCLLVAVLRLYLLLLLHVRLGGCG